VAGNGAMVPQKKRAPRHRFMASGVPWAFLFEGRQGE
jgi:hypothetical protein